MSTAAIRSFEGEVVCVWDHGMFRTERVNGFFDAFRHVWRAEGLSGLWKGAGTTLCVRYAYGGRAYTLTIRVLF